MSERGSFRGGGGGRGPRGGGGGDRRGGSHSTRGGARHQGDRGGDRHGGDRDQQEKPKKENILDLTKYMDKEVIVKFNGGREGLSPFYCPRGFRGANDCI